MKRTIKEKIAFLECVDYIYGIAIYHLESFQGCDPNDVCSVARQKAWSEICKAIEKMAE